MNRDRKFDIHLTHTKDVRLRMERLVKALNAKFPGARFTQASVTQTVIEHGLTIVEKEAQK